MLYPHDRHTGTIRHVQKQNSPAAAVTLSLAVIMVVAFLLIPRALSQTDLSRPPALPILPGWIFYSCGVLLIGALCLSAAFLARDVLRGAPSPDTERILERRRMFRIVAGVILAFFVFYLLAALALSFVRMDDEIQEQTRQLSAEFAATEDTATDMDLRESDGGSELVSSGTDDGERRTRILALCIAIAASAISIFLGIRYARSVRSEPMQLEGGETDLFRRELLDTARSVLQRLVEQGDDRSAVIAAYAMVEDTFSRTGYARHESQTPKEFFSEVMLSTDVISTEAGRGALVDLAALYEIAKFSDHPISHGERIRAISLVESVERQLSLSVSERG